MVLACLDPNPQLRPTFDELRAGVLDLPTIVSPPLVDPIVWLRNDDISNLTPLAAGFSAAVQKAVLIGPEETRHVCVKGPRVESRFIRGGVQLTAEVKHSWNVNILEEAVLLSSLPNHPNVLPLLGAVVLEDETVGLVTPHVLGGTVADHLQFNSPWFEMTGNIKYLLENVCAAVQCLHEANIVHGDGASPPHDHSHPIRLLLLFLLPLRHPPSYRHLIIYPPTI